MLRIRLLGELGVEADSGPLVVPAGRPARALLAWLALHPGMSSRSRLAGTLWPEVREDSARMSLRSALADVRRALGRQGAALVSTREAVGLADGVWVDVQAFEELADRGRLEEALDLCRGELLPGLGDDWVHEAREEHRARWTAVLAADAGAAEARGEFAVAVDRTREWVRVDPLAEEAHRALIRRLDARGERAAALTAYARLRERLRRELGVAPSHETRALVERIRTDEVAAVCPPFPGPLGRAQRSAFVGRAHELSVLSGAWRRAQHGERRLALVAGEPGVGKTRLAGEFARRVHAAGATVLLGRSYEESTVAYQPFADALRPYLLAGGAEVGELERLVPGLATAAVGGDADPQAVRFRVFEAMSALLVSAARDRPVLLVLDDLHWADKASLLLLCHLVRAPEPARVLVVGTCREEGVGPGAPLSATVADLRRDRAVERIALRGLGERDVAALVRGWTGAGAPRGFAAALHRETGGNPFFVEELLQELGDRTPSAVEAASVVAEVGMPQGVKDVIAKRLSTLSGDARRLLALGSVIGRDFDASLLRSLQEVPEDERSVEALDECLEAGLIRADPDAPDRCSFVHPLVHEAIYDTLGAARRARLHAQVAGALMLRYGQRPDHLGEIARHLARAPGPEAADGAVSYAARAGQLALAQLAYEQAAAQFELALAAVERTDAPGDTTRCELLLALGDARTRSGDREHGQVAFADAAAAARRLGRADLLTRAALGFGGIGVTISEPDQAIVRIVSEALDALGELHGDLRARLLARLAVELYYAPDRSRAERLSAEAVRLAEAGANATVLAEALSARHVALWRPAHVRERRGIADEMVDLAERAGDVVTALQARNWRILDLVELGERGSLVAELDVYNRLAEEARLPAYQWYAPMWRATLALLDGRLHDVPGLWSHARALGARAGDANAEHCYGIVHSFHLPVEQGRFDAVDIGFQRERAQASPAAAAYRIGLARVLAELGRGDEAGEELEHAAPGGLQSLPRDMNWLSTLAELARTCSLLGDAGRATEAYELLRPYAGLNIVDARAIYCYGSAAHYLGLCAATIGQSRDACEHYEQALQFNRSLGAWPHVCRTLLAFAKTLLATRTPEDRDRAAKLATEAAGIAQRLAIPALSKEARGMAEEVSAAGARA